MENYIKLLIILIIILVCAISFLKIGEQNQSKKIAEVFLDIVKNEKPDTDKAIKDLKRNIEDFDESTDEYMYSYECGWYDAIYKMMEKIDKGGI